MAAVDSFKLFSKTQMKKSISKWLKVRKSQHFIIYGKKNTVSNIFKKIKFSAKNIRQKKHINLYDKSVILWKLYMEKFQLKKAVTL